MTVLKVKFENISPETITKLKIDVGNLQADKADKEERLRKLETSSSTLDGKWGIIAMGGAAMISAGVGVLFKVLF